MLRYMSCLSRLLRTTNSHSESDTMTGHPSETNMEQMFPGIEAGNARPVSQTPVSDGSQWRLVGSDGSSNPVDVGPSSSEPTETNAAPQPTEVKSEPTIPAVSVTQDTTVRAISAGGIDLEMAAPATSHINAVAPTFTTAKPTFDLAPASKVANTRTPELSRPKKSPKPSLNLNNVKQTPKTQSAQAPFGGEVGCVAIDEKPSKCNRSIDASLGKLIQAWPTLPENLKKAIEAVIDTAR